VARIRARDLALARRRAAHPADFAPFTLDEYRAMPIDYSFFDQCVLWPVADTAHPASQVVAADASFPRIPVLVLSGELDNMTTVADGAASAAQFPRARQVVLVNSFHVNALPHARSPCGAELVRRFIAALDPGDIGCASAVPPVRLAPPFARHWVEVEPARAVAGNAADTAALRKAAAALDAAGDLFGRVAANASGHGVGLRGGRFEVRDTPTGRHVDLIAVRWTEDLEVSGTLDLPPRSGEAAVTLEFKAADGVVGRLTARWPEGGVDAHAHLEGQVDGVALAADMPAP
jgi:hypothetical protein